MKLINSSQNTILSHYAKVCTSWWSKARGLMFSRKKTLVFVFKKPKKVSLHMVGVLFPIDIILLDEEKRVIEIKKNLRPFQFFEGARKASYVIETPAGNLKKSQTIQGHQLLW